MTTPRTYLLSPIDAWFFRDGRPYNQKETNQTDVVSLFPPPASTVVGAIRAGLARANGWTSGKTWPQTLNAVLGDGFDELGMLRFGGPFLAKSSSDGQVQVRFPMPLHLLGRTAKHDEPDANGWQPLCMLTPGDEVPCDLGHVRLPVRDRQVENGAKEPTNQWVTSAGLQVILSGQLPPDKEILPATKFWAQESRVGLQRGEATRTVGEGDLYSPRFVRLHPGVSLVMRVTGLPDEFHPPPSLFPFGGENRLADCSLTTDWTLPTPPSLVADSGGAVRFTVTLLTPLMLPMESDGTVRQPTVGQSLPGLPDSKIVSACVGKSQSIGGWDSTKNKPLPLRPVLPAGSTWFCECGRGSWPTVLDLHGRHIGDKTSFGYGQIVLGQWHDSLARRSAS